LGKAVADPYALEFRREMMMASLLAGLAFSNASLGAVHALAHALGGKLNLPHGACNAILLPHVVRFNFAAATEKYLALGRAMDLDCSGISQERAAVMLIERLQQLERETGFAQTLAEFGLTPEQIPQLAANASADPCLVTNPRPMTLQDIQELYARALAG
jgi:alcohol dehydrogenase class IV